jgi:DNA excision repair protein ERCC-2
MAGWRDVFGHEEPYDDQADGIETAVETAREGGFTVVEGACGTGKTMLALTAGIHLVRDPDSRFERVLVLTSVKQQLRQFEADVETINADLPDDWRPVSGLTLVGKGDLCPYNRAGAGGVTDDNVYERCDSLRERTRDLTGDGPTTAATLAADARRQQVGLTGDAVGRGDDAPGATYVEAAGEAAPYPPEMPTYEDTEYCPFYAQYLDDLPEDGDPAEAVPFDHTSTGHLAPDDLVAAAVEYGSCPHSVLGAALGRSEVLVGNYYHAFDPQTTAGMTGALLDDSTFVVCDEAHMLEPRVRDLVSDGVADTTLRDAAAELTRVVQAARAEGEVAGPADPATVRAELQETEVGLDDVAAVREFIRDLRDELDRRVTAFLDREHSGWRGSLRELPDEEMPLRDPETPEPDAVSEWAAAEGYGDAWALAESVGAAVAHVLDAAEDEERRRACLSAGRALGAWGRNDHERYFREVTLERTWDTTEPDGSWRRAYTARLDVQNCLPGDAIGERLAEFGGGVLMSATLAPLDVFADVTGLADLPDERPVVQRRYGLAFPAENRASFAVDAPKFTHDNRGRPGEGTRVRQTYVDAVREVARSPGNVLVGMPSYREAEWMAGALEDAPLRKPVLLDEASDDRRTERLKESFFDGEGKVLVTSLRGTLTEGVDYRGDRLAAAVVCGVPLINTASPRTRALRTAYDREFGDGFETALTVPAVRKARQALGRVIRGPGEVGVRALVDARYARDAWDSVREYLPPAEREAYRTVSPDMLGLGLDRFWERHGASRTEP